MSRRQQIARPSSARARTKVVGTLFHGRLRLEKLPTTENISARLYTQGKYVRKSTGESTLARAKDVASEWFKDLLTRDRNGQRIHGATFADYAKSFLQRIDARCDAGALGTLHFAEFDIKLGENFAGDDLRGEWHLFSQHQVFHSKEPMRLAWKGDSSNPIRKEIADDHDNQH